MKLIMKAKLLLLLAIMLPLWACSQTRMLNSLPTGDGITKVYIGPAMMKLSGGMVDKYASEYSNVIKDIKSVEVYSCENKLKCALVIAEFEKLLTKYNTEQMVESEEGGERSLIYIIMDKDNEEIGGMLIFNSEPGEVDIVAINGKIDPSAFVQQ
ncbi:MAG: DUF4252 domain-containing protein [Barnesiella sp.]|nr:DUF4252 domain-containing protein [Barnesiella sp.]